MKKIIGIWFYTRVRDVETYGQVYTGKHRHRTSSEFEHYQSWEPTAIADMCIGKSWPYMYLFS